MAHTHHRIYTFDLLRGLAVISMMLAHSVYFLHTRDNDFLLSVEGFGNTVSFVTFLLVAGAVAWVAYFGGQPDDGRVKRKRVFTRVMLLLIAYYLLALSLIATDLLRTEGFARLKLIGDILLFRHLPGYTEYFPPFIFYSALLILVPRWFWIASRSLKNVILVSLLAWLAGWALYQVPVGPVLRPWIALLAGAEGLYRFPLLHYLPVFLLGLYWGKRTLQSEGLRPKLFLSWRLAGFFGFLVALAWLATHFLGISPKIMFSRWPPSVPFLALGLGSAFLAAALLYTFRQLRQVRLLRDLLLVFGQNALGLFWSHIFLLGLYDVASGPKVSSLAVFLFLFLLLIFLSLALTTFIPFNFRLALTSARGSHEEYEEALGNEAIFRLSQDVTTEAAQTSKGLRQYFFPNRSVTNKRRLKKRHKLGISLMVFAAASIIFPATIEEIALQGQEQRMSAWWSDAYAYRQQLTLRNTESFVTLQPGDQVAMRFNHKQLVDEGKSDANGLDVKLVYWNGQEHVVAESYVENPASEEATLKFRAPEKIQSGKDERFYSLYYGSFIGPQPQNFTLKTEVTVPASFKPEERYPLVAKVSTNWNLIGEPGSNMITFNVTPTQRYESQTVTYQILGTPLAGTMTRGAETSWEALIPIDTLAPGTYRIQATLRNGDRVQVSQQAGFYRSYPLYVAWTHDWEGYDVKQAYLDAMEAIAKQYQLPITHFFNPRIYVTETITPQRAQAMTQWVKRRLKLGDAFGLHLHMQTDLVEHAGIAPETELNWGDRGDGYGAPLSAYTKDEQVQVIRSALNLLAANGFGQTDLFRAGGWFANLDTFAALEQLGFTADSSARTAYKFGRNQLPGFWNILPITRPYYPSRTNQNRSTGSNDFPVLEIPNNGADSYAFSAQDMINRFTVNIGSGVLTQKQQLTYLSHPHWFDDKEQSRIRELFAFISRHTFSNDRGPVIFTTTEAIATLWTNAD